LRSVVSDTLFSSFSRQHIWAPGQQATLLPGGPQPRRIFERAASQKRAIVFFDEGFHEHDAA
jgi:hypothetical protein